MILSIKRDTKPKTIMIIIKKIKFIEDNFLNKTKKAIQKNKKAINSIINNLICSIFSKYNIGDAVKFNLKEDINFIVTSRVYI
jgi:hypothetical protein